MQSRRQLRSDKRGKVLRISGLDPGSQRVQWEVPAGIEMVAERGADGMRCHRLVVNEIPASRDWYSWAIESQHALNLVPNRSYIISALVDCDFDRPVEINIGLRSVDGGGKYVMWQFNGLPNKTNGWQRWEWEVTADPQAVGAIFGVDIYDFPKQGTFRIADVAFIELPPKKLVSYAKGEGVTFRGGPGNLPMRVVGANEDGNTIEVRTTGAAYTFDLAANTVKAKQLLERARDVCTWSLSLPLKGLEVVRWNEKECVLGSDALTMGVQCDSLLVIAPHDELMLECQSGIGGKWNRYACGHMLIRDDLGGFAVNPDIPAGTGRLARTNINQMPGWLKAGALDFSGKINDLNFLSTADPGWKAKWYLSPGERIGISVFPPRPFPWKQSFNRAFTLAHRTTPPEAYAKFTGMVDILIMWDFLMRSWAMSYGREHAAHDEKLLLEHVTAMNQAGIAPIMYMSGWFYYSRDAAEFTGEVKRIRDRYGISGVYFDGIPLEWPVAYEEMRMTRELFPDGVIVLHHTYPAPLMEASIELPAVASYADVTWMAELVYGEGKDWVYPRYFISQYRKANVVGAMLHDHWQYGTRVDKDLMMLRHNGRATAPGLPWKEGPDSGVFGEWAKRYLPVVRELKRLWEEKGGEPDFFEAYYLPRVLELTKDLPSE